MECDFSRPAGGKSKFNAMPVSVTVFDEQAEEDLTDNLLEMWANPMGAAQDKLRDAGENAASTLISMAVDDGTLQKQYNMGNKRFIGRAKCTLSHSTLLKANDIQYKHPRY